MANPFSLSGWLRRQPQPVAVLVEREGGKEARVEVGKDGRNWRNCIRTLEGLKPYTRLTLLDVKGDILRAEQFDPAKDDEDKSDDVKHDSSDPTVVFAKLLADATKDQPILRHAMEYISKISENNGSLMADNEKLRAENSKLRLEIGKLQMMPLEGDDEGGGVVGLVAQIAAGMQAGQMAKAQQPKLQQVPSAAPKEGVK